MYYFTWFERGFQQKPRNSPGSATDTLTIYSRSFSDSCSGDSIAIFINFDRLISSMQFRSRLLINFICKKGLSTDR